MSVNRAADYLAHIQKSASDARSFVEGMSFADFQADKRTQQAVILSLVIIGEAAGKLLEHHAAFLTGHPGVPWASMKGMRNRLAHGYFDIDLQIVWDTVQAALPQVLIELPAVLNAAARDDGK
jgi:uncharacterized protein with HEPN domain